MSNIGTITFSREKQREHLTADGKQTLAAEMTADALEGIRQDLTLISGHLTKIVSALERLASKS